VALLPLTAGGDVYIFEQPTIRPEATFLSMEGRYAFHQEREDAEIAIIMEVIAWSTDNAAVMQVCGSSGCMAG
jgi:hypothetical protein